MKLVALALVLTGCAGSHHGDTAGGGALQTGALIDPKTSDTGPEIRVFGGMATDDLAIPNAYAFSVRDVGSDVQTSAQWGWAVAGELGSAKVYGRLMFDVINRNTIDHVTSLSAFSPTADLGIAPFGHGLCFSASATWDVHFDAPDRLLVGGYVGLCGGKL
jgi:hypothetical protein